jgi:hypothetical protein
MFQYRSLATAFLLFSVGLAVLLLAPTKPAVEPDQETIRRVIWALGP